MLRTWFLLQRVTDINILGPYKLTDKTYTIKVTLFDPADDKQVRDIFSSDFCILLCVTQH